MALTFYRVFNSLYLILVNSKIAGKLVFDKEQELIILDIHGWFYHELRDILLDTLLFEFGFDYITLNTITKYKEYYEELGFRMDKTIDNESIKMIYGVRMYIKKIKCI